MSSRQLLKAINSADDARLRKTLTAVLADPHGRQVVERELLVEERESANVNGGPPQPAATSKKRNRYEICNQCKGEFDVTDRAVDECVWHPGECEIDYDSEVWQDTDNDLASTEEMKDEYPEAFLWSCCDGDANAECCRTGYHKASSGQKRTRR